MDDLSGEPGLTVIAPPEAGNFFFSKLSIWSRRSTLSIAILSILMLQSLLDADLKRCGQPGGEHQFTGAGQQTQPFGCVGRRIRDSFDQPRSLPKQKLIQPIQRQRPEAGSPACLHNLGPVNRSSEVLLAGISQRINHHLVPTKRAQRARETIWRCQEFIPGRAVIDRDYVSAIE